jgi:nicotinamide riboside kinase
VTVFINIFGGPGTGKSTTAASLFTKMKIAGYSVELVTEVAKDFVWEEREKTMDIQPYITIKQYRNLFRLKGKVDYVVGDASILMGILYAREYATNLPPSYEKFVYDLHNQMLSPSLNIFLERSHAYDINGRYQTEDQARQLDRNLIKVLDDYQVEYVRMQPDEVIDFIMSTEFGAHGVW